MDVTVWDVFVKDLTNIPIRVNSYGPKFKCVAEATMIALQAKSDLLYLQCKIKVYVEGRTEHVENIYG